MSMIDIDDTEDIFDETAEPAGNATEAADGQLYEHWSIDVDPGQKPVRIDKFLAEKNPYQSRNRIQQAAEAGCIFVNGAPVKSNYKIRPNDVIKLMLA